MLYYEVTFKKGLFFKRSMIFLVHEDKGGAYWVILKPAGELNVDGHIKLSGGYAEEAPMTEGFLSVPFRLRAEAVHLMAHRNYERWLERPRP